MFPLSKTELCVAWYEPWLYVDTSSKHFIRVSGICTSNSCRYVYIHIWHILDHQRHGKNTPFFWSKVTMKPSIIKSVLGWGVRALSTWKLTWYGMLTGFHTSILLGLLVQAHCTLLRYTHRCICNHAYYHRLVQRGQQEASMIGTNSTEANGQLQDCKNKHESSYIIAKLSCGSIFYLKRLVYFFFAKHQKS